MKTNIQYPFYIKFILLAVFLVLNSQSKAQSQYLIGSHVKLSTESGGKIKEIINESEIISLVDETSWFTAMVCLFPMVENPDAEDSLVEENNLLELTFNGQFPIDNFSYYFNVNDNDTYNMNGLLTANGISIPYTLTFTVRTLPTADPIDENDINAIDDYYYPVKISFAIEMDPKDYKLNLEPIALKNVIIAEVVDGIINKRF